ncbi:protein hairless [Toxorhynchites rutilus septentrionalis]|uniref:protein hairless n=1 Tax=Toxorhynchites rutilus septentrionalis TaxID=329112 RepID=UPI00247A2A91|nr:protein hairless [Toxorhynchites rutilus septentrionalis]XP_055640249.1 protein hairless [Toxorhynchites rutilus septentrionalis]
MYIINPTSGKEIPNSYPTSSSSASSSSNGSSSHQQEIISKILTKCATMTDEVATSGSTAATTVNGTATILLSPPHHHSHHHHQHPVGVSPQSSPASSSSAASSPTADGPQQLQQQQQQLHNSFGTVREKAATSARATTNSGAGTNGTTGPIGLTTVGSIEGKHASSTSCSKINGNGTLPAPTGVVGGNVSGGRLQFFKDGKFILELARAREGEKTSWISVPRKTYWPPTVSSTSANFHKHESSTSLSFSDDNSSIQSSPWQRDHCWKQSNPRSNISKEMSLYFHRPICVRLKLPPQSLKRLRLKRRRPYDASSMALEYEIINDRSELPTDADSDSMDLKVNGRSPESGSDDDEGKSMENGSKERKKRKRSEGGQKRRKELTAILQQLTVRVANSVNCTPRLSTPGIRNVFGSSHQQHVSPRKRILRELEKVSLEDSSTMKRSRPKHASNSTVITATTATPLAPATSNGVGSCNSVGSSNNSNNSNGKLTNGSPVVSSIAESRTPSIPTTPVSRPLSSYSITSLLGHNSSSENNSRFKQETNSTTSHHPYQQQPQQQHHQPSHYQYLGKDMITSPKSPSDAHLSQRYYGKKKSPSYGSQSAAAVASPGSATDFGTSYGMIRSPDLSPSPEHQTHSFTRYRQHPYSVNPTVSSPSSYSTVSRCSPSPSTNDSASSPYSGNAKYRAAYLASSGSPPSSTNPVTANSPQHYSRQSPLNFARSPPPLQQPSYPPIGSIRSNGKDSSSSPRASPSVEPVRVPATTPSTTSSNNSTTPSIRTVPKKTAALRQQFGSPSSSPSTIDTASKRERSNSNASSTSSDVNRAAHLKKELDYAERASASDVVDGHPHLSSSSLSQASPVIRPSTVIASPTPHHPVPNPFYMYPPQIAASLIAAQQSASAVPFLPASPLTSYYQHMYNQAAVAAAYRNPLWMHYQGMTPHAAAAAAAAAAASTVSPPLGAPPPAQSVTVSSAASSTHSSNNSIRDAQQRDSNRSHSATITTSSSSSSSVPTTAVAALNYSASALASPYHAHHHHQQNPHHQHLHHSGLSAPWSIPSNHDPATRTPPVTSSSGPSTGPPTKDDLGTDVPLNLSKH